MEGLLSTTPTPSRFYIYFVKNIQCFPKHIIINRPGVAGAVLQKKITWVSLFLQIFKTTWKVYASLIYFLVLNFNNKSIDPLVQQAFQSLFTILLSLFYLWVLILQTVGHFQVFADIIVTYHLFHTHYAWGATNHRSVRTTFLCRYLRRRILVCTATVIVTIATVNAVHQEWPTLIVFIHLFWNHLPQLT